MYMICLQVIEETRAPNSIYMIMEYVEGGDSMSLQKNDLQDPNYVPTFVCSRTGTVMGVRLCLQADGVVAYMCVHILLAESLIYLFCIFSGNSSCHSVQTAPQCDEISAPQQNCS